MHFLPFCILVLELLQVGLLKNIPKLPGLDDQISKRGVNVNISVNVRGFCCCGDHRGDCCNADGTPNGNCTSDICNCGCGCSTEGQGSTTTSRRVAPGFLWNYASQDLWPQMYPACGSQRQSPLFLASTFFLNPTITYETPFDEIQYGNYDRMITGLTMINNGRWVQVDVPQTGDVPYIAGGNLTTRYNLQYIEFHSPSEHLVRNDVFDELEMHLVHERDPSSPNNNEYSIAALAVLFIGGSFPPGGMPEQVSNAAQQVQGGAGLTATVDPFRLFDMLPDNRTDFFRYPGSLTYPPCTENVMWTVFGEKKSVTLEQLNIFRDMQLGARQLQAVNDRQILTNIETPGLDYIPTQTTTQSTTNN